VVLLAFLQSLGLAQSLTIHPTPQPGDFSFVANGRAAPLIIDASAPRVVQIAANCLADDIERVTGVRPTIGNDAPPQNGAVVIRTNPSDKWESFELTFKDGNLIVTGSDRRGTAFGGFELSRAIGVSPWSWWADVPPRHRDSLYIAPREIKQGPPSVKYRGVFLNDEDWGLHPWAAKTFEPEAHGVGPKTYAKIFELLLRLKANYCWPAMHECSPAFNADPGNKQVADDYAIVMGSSHCEQMLCNNVTEWPRDSHDKWNPVTNLPAIAEYWEKRVTQNAKFESVWTVGMRGIHDGGMPGGGTISEKRERLEHIINLQRDLLAKHVNTDVTQVPQIFCPYKEVLDLYRDHMKLPDDITIVWPDDNYGYIRQLPDAKERMRAGGSGIYYHLSYNGKPHDYLWLESISPALIWEEMTKAYDFGASRLWVVNVGDLKPIEAGTTLFLQLAWDINSYGPDVSKRFLHDFYAEQFGAEHADAIAEMMGEYFRLASIRKPETLGFNTTYPTTKVRDSDFTPEERMRRLVDYLNLALKAEAHEGKLAAEARPAYFELVLYPIAAATAMNEKMICAEESRLCAAAGQKEAADHFAAGAEAAAARIEVLTARYNGQLNGKWRGMMDCHPRKLPVFAKPVVARVTGLRGGEAPAEPHSPASAPARPEPRPPGTQPIADIAIDAIHFARLIERESHWTPIEGLGRRGGSLILLPRAKAKSFHDVKELQQQAPIAEYPIHIAQGGEAEVIVETLPTQPIDSEHALLVAVGIDDEFPVTATVEQANDENSKLWQTNALKNAAFARLKLNVAAGDHILKLYGADPSVGVQRITLAFVSSPTGRGLR
jgi:hypothetical protein